MIAARAILKGMETLPYLKEFWSWLKVNPENPHRPDEKAVIVAAIMDEGERMPEGYVFLLFSTDYYYGRVGGASGQLYANELKRIIKPSPLLVEKGGMGNIQAYRVLDPKGDGSNLKAITDSDTISRISEAYYGEAQTNNGLASLSLT